MATEIEIEEFNKKILGMKKENVEILITPSVLPPKLSTDNTDEIQIGTPDLREKNIVENEIEPQGAILDPKQNIGIEIENIDNYIDEAKAVSDVKDLENTAGKGVKNDSEVEFEIDDIRKEGIELDQSIGEAKKDESKVELEGVSKYIDEAQLTEERRTELQRVSGEDVKLERESESGKYYGREENSPINEIEKIPGEADFTKVDPYMYTQVPYGPKGGSLGIEGAFDKTTSKNLTPTKYTTGEAERKVRDRNSELGIFLYNLLPYFGSGIISGVADGIMSTVKNPIALSSLTRLSTLALSTYNIALQTKYMTPAEMVAFFSSNFYFLHFFRGISIKKGKKGISIATAADVWDGKPDIHYGENIVTGFHIPAGDLEGDLKKALFPVKAAEDPNVALKQEKSYNTPKINLDATNSTVDFSVPSAVCPGAKDTRTYHTPVKFTYNFSDMKWKKLDDVVEPFAQNELEYRGKTRDVVNLDQLTINKEVIKVELNPGFSPTNRSYLNKVSKPDVKKAGEGKGFLEKEGRYQIGAVYVIPIASDRDEFPRSWIPFEFNPMIEESPMSAKYQASTILSRIGDLQSYTSSDLLNLTLTTKYFAVSHSNRIAPDDGYAWMSEFTLTNIQAIELAYRSLIYPCFPEGVEKQGSSTNLGYQYVRPPIVKIIIGKEKIASPYSNLLTYQNKKVVKPGEKFKSQGGEKTIYRSFIVTSVNVKKDLETMPLFMDSEFFLQDTFGFDLTLTLIEISPSYMDLVPNYKDYFKQYKEVMGNCVESRNG